MKRFRHWGSLVSVAVLLLLGAAVATATDIPLKNWQAPKTWTPAAPQASGGRSALVTTSYPPLPYIPLPPCRVVDTRLGSGFSGGYGPPALAAQATRAFTIGGQCGIPTDAQAVSFEFTAVNMTANGNFRAWPAGVTMPTASVLNWTATTSVIGNGIVVPVGGSPGVLEVYLNGPLSSTVDLVLDVNGFYGPTPADQTQYFTLNTNSNYTMRLDNASTTCSGACGILQTVASGTAIDGQTSSTNATEAGVYGYANAGYGVEGQTNAAHLDAAAVLGIDRLGAGSPTGYQSAGVRGEGFIGVLGITNQSSTAVGAYTSASNAVGVDAVSTGSGSYGVYGYGIAYGVYADGNMGASGTKPFVEPHPTDPTLVIRFVALEGPEAGTYFRGTATTVDRRAVIPVPESFRIVTAEEGLTVQLTPVGDLAQMAVITRDLNQIVVRSSRDVTFDYHVNGVRRAYKDWQVVAEGQEYADGRPPTRRCRPLSRRRRRRA